MILALISGQKFDERISISFTSMMIDDCTDVHFRLLALEYHKPYPIVSYDDAGRCNILSDLENQTSAHNLLNMIGFQRYGHS
jgi:hypothetical protein